VEEAQPYDKASIASILEFAQKLTGKSLAEMSWLPENVVNTRNRGNLGKLVEDFYFGINPGNGPAPDFPDAKLELKVTGVTRNPGDKAFRAKERLVLKQIHYSSLAGEDWETSSLVHKCRQMLLMFYTYDSKKLVTKFRFELEPLVYDLFGEDLEVIRRDWETIRQMVVDGKAHELSEGDTFYLGACRKGSGGPDESLQEQPFSEIRAKTRAFSFKQSYLNQIVTRHSTRAPSILDLGSTSIADVTREKFERFIGEPVDDIAANFQLSQGGNGFWRLLANNILTSSNSEPVELAKAGIEMKTIRLRSTGMPRESMSFPNFKYVDIINEDWEDSVFFERLERKFLFVVFRTGNDKIERLEKVAYWNMPYSDRMEARKVWEETKRRVAYDATKLPTSRESRVAHVRPKAKNARDTEQTPQGTWLVKKCFWLNSSYIRDVVAEI
jgi:DNA mismatch repair protein MutH